MSGNICNTVSATDFHGALDEKLNNMYETMKQQLKVLPEVREQMAELGTKTCALLNPSLCCQIANLEDKILNKTSKINTNIQRLKIQNENADVCLATLKSRSANSK